MNIPEFYLSPTNVFFGDCNFEALVRHNRPAITQILTYEVEQTTRIGTDRGLNYGHGFERPGFISPPSEPMEALVNLRREMKKEVQAMTLWATENFPDGIVLYGQPLIIRR